MFGIFKALLVVCVCQCGLGKVGGVVVEGGWSGCGGWVEWLWRVGGVVVEGG